MTWSLDRWRFHMGKARRLLANREQLPVLVSEDEHQETEDSTVEALELNLTRMARNHLAELAGLADHAPDSGLAWSMVEEMRHWANRD